MFLFQGILFCNHFHINIYIMELVQMYQHILRREEIIIVRALSPSNVGFCLIYLRDAAKHGRKSVQCTMYSIQSTAYNTHVILFCIYSLLYNVDCPVLLYSVCFTDVQ